MFLSRKGKNLPVVLCLASFEHLLARSFASSERSPINCGISFEIHLRFIIGHGWSGPVGKAARWAFLGHRGEKVLVFLLPAVLAFCQALVVHFRCFSLGAKFLEIMLLYKSALSLHHFSRLHQPLALRRNALLVETFASETKIVWPVQNCPVPNDVRAEDVAVNICMALKTHPIVGGPVTVFSAYGDFNQVLVIAFVRLVDGHPLVDRSQNFESERIPDFWWPFFLTTVGKSVKVEGPR